MPEISFNFTIPRAEGPLVELTFEEAEKRVLRRLEDERDHPEECVWELVRFYSHAGKQDVALNVLGQHVEAESLCRAAFRIEPGRPNGHKNLGIALVGQERIDEAARAFVEANKANASDPRALRHLEDLLGKHPELEVRMPESREQLASCRKAVQVAAAIQEAMAPRVHRGLAKWWYLLVADVRRRLGRWFGRR